MKACKFHCTSYAPKAKPPFLVQAIIQAFSCLMFHQFYQGITG